MRTLILGTRRSKLAMWQADWVKRLLAEVGVQVRIEAMVSPGDRDRDRPLYALGETGVFTKMLEEALMYGRIDAAVHSLKDLPTQLPEELDLGAVLLRADPRDALVVRDPSWRAVSDLPSGAMVGTSSLRRAAQLRHMRPDVNIVPLRGNVPTRLTKVREGRGGLSAALLATAGLERLDLADQIAAVLDPMDMMPAPAQGAVAVEVRADSVAGELVSPIAHEPTWNAVRAERAMLAHVEGGCHAPVAAYTKDDRVVYGRVAAVDGSRSITEHVGLDPDDPEKSGEILGEALLAAGAGELVQIARSEVRESASETSE